MRTRQVVIAAAAVALSTIVPGSPAAAGGGGGCRSTALSDTATAEVSMQAACFRPTVARVGVGETVTFRNDDPMTHAVTGAAGSFGDYESIEPGESVEHTFDEEGVFPYFCVLHPSMVGAVVVDGELEAAGAGAGGGVVTGLAVAAGVVLAAAGLAVARRSRAGA